MNEENGPAIVAFLGTQAIGDYIMYHLVAASIAREFPGSRLGIIYRDDRPYKTFINSANPYVSAALRVDEDPNAVVPIDLFDGRSDAPDRIPDETWDKLGLYRPDIFLTPSMLSMFACIWPPPAFRVPKEAAETLGQKLKDRGLDGDRWFVCLHIREPGYVHRPGSDPNRDADPTSYLPMIEDIIRNLGGQVVRIGHSDTTPMPEMEGMIDLSREDDCFPEQAFAISRARYFIGSDSGPTQLASAFKTPTATTNAMGLGIWNDGDVALLKTYLGRFDTEPLEFDDVYEILPVRVQDPLQSIEVLRQSLEYLPFSNIHKCISLNVLVKREFTVNHAVQYVQCHVLGQANLQNTLPELLPCQFYLFCQRYLFFPGQKGYFPHL